MSLGCLITVVCLFIFLSVLNDIARDLYERKRDKGND
jgi:hypothetical protein